MAVDHSMPVLIVDDYKTMIRIIRNLLKQLGFANVDEAGDGSAALDMMRQKDYGLVISDWNMEPMTGYELLREVRADDRLSRTPFIMVTAESKTDNVIAAKKAGVNNYIVKPFNAATLEGEDRRRFRRIATQKGDWGHARAREDYPPGAAATARAGQASSSAAARSPKRSRCW